MKNRYLGLTAILLLIATIFSTPAQAQYVHIPVGAGIGLVQAIAAQNAANRAMEERTTTLTTYHGVNFRMKRTPEELLTGEATDRIRQVEAQLALAYSALLADSTTRTCPPERQTAIRAGVDYLSRNRPSWGLSSYRQELKLYLAEDKRRLRATR